MAVEKFVEFCRRIGGTVQHKGRAPMSAVEEVVCYIPENVSITGITKVGDRIEVGVTSGYGVRPVELYGVDELVAYDVEKVALDEKESIEFSEKPKRISAEIYPTGRMRIFVD